MVLISSAFIFSSVTGSYLDKHGYTITKPGHGGGAIQFVARKGSIRIGIYHLSLSLYQLSLSF